MSDCFHSESENCKFQMYRFNAEDPGQSQYTPTTVGVITNLRQNDYNNLIMSCMLFTTHSAVTDNVHMHHTAA